MQGFYSLGLQLSKKPKAIVTTATMAFGLRMSRIYEVNCDRYPCFKKVGLRIRAVQPEPVLLHLLTLEVHQLPGLDNE